MAPFYLSPLAGRGRRAAPAASRVRGTLDELRTSRVPLTRIPLLRLRCARNPTSPRKRGEVKKRKPREPNLAPMPESGRESRLRSGAAKPLIGLAAAGMVRLHYRPFHHRRWGVAKW